jgi:hypothetical protein
MTCDGKAGYKLNTQMPAQISMFQPHVALPKLVKGSSVRGPGLQLAGITEGLDENRHSFVAQWKA